MIPKSDETEGYAGPGCQGQGVRDMSRGTNKRGMNRIGHYRYDHSQQRSEAVYSRCYHYESPTQDAKQGFQQASLRLQYELAINSGNETARYLRRVSRRGDLLLQVKGTFWWSVREGSAKENRIGDPKKCG
jgi:hypothetical protein